MPDLPLIFDSVVISEKIFYEVGHEENEYLYATTLGGTITPTDSANMIDGAFNDSVGYWDSQTGNVLFTAFEDTAYTDFNTIQKVLLQIRLDFSAYNVNDTFVIEIWDGTVWTEIINFSASGDGFATPSIITLDATGILNSIAKIDGCQVRFTNVMQGSPDYTVSIDTARLEIILHSAEEFLWGEEVTTAIALINYQHCIDARFNGLESEFIMASGTILFNKLFDTIETVIDDFSEIFAETKWHATAPQIDDVIVLEVYNGTSWTPLETWTAGVNPWPVNIDSLFSYNITSLFTSIASLNNAQMRFVTTKNAGADADIHLDEVRIKIKTLRIKISDFVDINAEDYVTMQMISRPNIWENISVAEDVSIVLDQLSINVSELSGILITEHVDVVDLVVEVGVIADFISEICIAEMLLDVLNINISDSIFVTEECTASLDVLNIDAGADIDITDGVSFLLSLGFIVSDEIEITEYINIGFSVLKISVADNITTAENINVTLDVLNVNVLESNGLLITEHIDVIDLVIEVGVVADFMTEVCFAEMLLDVLNISVGDDISITEDVQVLDIIIELSGYDNITVAESVELTFLASPEINVFDVTTVTEFIQVLDIIIELPAVDTITVTDSADVFLSDLTLAVYDDMTVTESVSVLDIIVEIGIVVDTGSVQEVVFVGLDSLFLSAGEDISIVDNISIGLDVLYFDVSDSVSIAEDVQLLDITVELFATDIITVTDFASVSIGGLSLAVFDGVLITDVVSVHDIIVEVGIAVDTATIEENVAVGLDALFLSVGDDIPVADDVQISLAVLNIIVSDEATITESVQLLDIVIELGIVFDDISIAEDVSIILSGAFLTATDNISVTESIALTFLNSPEVDVFDTAGITEFVQILDLALGVEAVDNISVTEYANLLDIVIELEIVFDESTLNESVSIYLDILNIDVSDSVLITEVAQIIDLVIEVGVVADTIGVSDSATAQLDVLNFSVSDTLAITEDFQFQLTVPPAGGSDDIVISEVVSVGLDQLFLFAQEPVGVFDIAIMTDLVIELGPVVENISVIDLGGPTLGELLISVSEDLNIEEWVTVFDPIIELGAGEDILVTEDLSVLTPVLYVRTHEDIGVH